MSAPLRFCRELREICTNEGIVLIFDEVYTGWGKTGHLFHFMKHQVVPDIVTMAKTFGGGKSSIAGYVTRSPVFRQAYDNLEDATLHSTTYNAFGEECATAIEAINIIVEDGYVTRAGQIYERVNTGLRRHPDEISQPDRGGAWKRRAERDSSEQRSQFRHPSGLPVRARVICQRRTVHRKAHNFLGDLGAVQHVTIS